MQLIKSNPVIKHNRGFSLIEVLVTIVLTTVGILGMVALQSKSIQYTQDAVNRNTAIALTNELVEILRANRDELFDRKPPQEPVYSRAKSSTVFYSSDGSLAFSASDCSTGVAQTATQQAGCWLRKVEAVLPAASETSISAHFKLCPSHSFSGGEPTCAGSDYKGSTLAVQLAWRSKDKVCGLEANSDVCTFSTRVEL